jgi:hypothetical protein
VPRATRPAGPAFVHVAGLYVRAAFQAFQTSNLFALFCNGLLQGSDFTQQFDRQRFQRWAA